MGDGPVGNVAYMALYAHRAHRVAFYELYCDTMAMIREHYSLPSPPPVGYAWNLLRVARYILIIAVVFILEGCLFESIR